MSKIVIVCIKNKSSNNKTYNFFGQKFNFLILLKKKLIKIRKSSPKSHAKSPSLLLSQSKQTTNRISSWNQLVNVNTVVFSIVAYNPECETHYYLFHLTDSDELPTLDQHLSEIHVSNKMYGMDQDEVSLNLDEIAARPPNRRYKPNQHNSRNETRTNCEN